MRPTRRQFIVSSSTFAGVFAGGITVLPFSASAGSHSGNVFKTPVGDITVHPVSHASFVMETPKGTLYVDPVGDVSSYGAFPKADLALITHHHGDHFNPDTLKGIVGADTKMITNPEVFGKLAGDMKGKAQSVSNGGEAMFRDLKIEAIPAHNLTKNRLKFHPKGRDNGYVLNFDGFRIYISGDTEDVPEMRALKDIDLAFVCMNLPFTMTAEAAADAVAQFKPKFVYPYHWRGRGPGTQDPKKFANLVADASEVRVLKWY